ncbi:MAG: phosphomannose isomerase type II C-terminal cupin domain [Rhodothermales bacterium]|nr:phosphomannose isomerase type II C-terminal cupin domain [Rhodothermales bacterium]MBO6780777.1 phosphomannose isomerase type II C-terminal cupin domain [Rhodothermales bacterium]
MSASTPLDADDRPWGRWEEYLNEPGYRVKRIIVHPGQRLSLQKHHKRSEHWAIAIGTGLFTLDDSVTRVNPGDALFIPLGGVHRIQNDGDENLIIIETQLGVCDEDDIVRLEDDYGRE